MRLIDADALTKEIKMDIEDVGLQERMIFHRINDAPTIDAVPVVRCKDCKWAEKAILDEYCVECTMMHTSCAKHGYCHHGERREP